MHVEEKYEIEPETLTEFDRLMILDAALCACEGLPGLPSLGMLQEEVDALTVINEHTRMGGEANGVGLDQRQMSSVRRFTNFPASFSGISPDDWKCHCEMQRMLGTVCAGALKQGVRSFRVPEDDFDNPGNIGCVYRGGVDGGLKCFIGMLISDSSYKPDLEKWNANSMEVGVALHASGYTTRYGSRSSTRRMEDFLMTLQNAHDEHPPCEWGNKLMQIVTLYQLDPTPVVPVLAWCRLGAPHHG